MFSVAKFIKYALLGLGVLAAWQVLIPYVKPSGLQFDVFSSFTHGQWNKVALGGLAIVGGGPWLFSSWKRQAVLQSWYGMVLWGRSDVPRTKAPRAFWLNVIAFGMIVLWGILEIVSAFVSLPFPRLWPST